MKVKTVGGKAKAAIAKTTPDPREILNPLLYSRTYFQPGQAVIVKIAQDALPQAGNFTLSNETTGTTLISEQAFQGEATYNDIVLEKTEASSEWRLVIPPHVVNTTSKMTWDGDGANTLRLTWHEDRTEQFVKSTVYLTGFAMLDMNITDLDEVSEGTAASGFEGWVSATDPPLAISTDATGAVQNLTSGHNLSLRY